MKERSNKFLILAVILIISIGMLSACFSSEKSGNTSNENVGTGKAQDQTATEGNQANVKATPSVTPVKKTDIFAGFKKDDDYKTIIRPQILKDGWQPARSEDGKMNCESDMPICEEYPELEAGPSSPAGDAIFRWKKGDKVVNVFTYDNQLYNSYEFEKSKETSQSTEISGKYSYRYTEDYGGEISFVFMPKGKVSFEWSQEDMTTKGVGSWSFDEADQTLNVKVFEQDVEPGDESQKTPRNAIYIFQKTGKNLKLTRLPERMEFFEGKTFQKK